MAKTMSLLRTGAGESLPVRLGIMLGGALFVSLGAQIDLPMYPVPMSLQTFAVSVVGLLCGPLLATLTLLTYLALGAAGLPVFAGGNGGLAALWGPTAGYLWGFVGMAWMTAWMVGRLERRNFANLYAAALVPSLLLMVPGVLWLAARSPLTLLEAIATGAAPFLIGKLVKTALAVICAQAARRMLAQEAGRGVAD